MCISGASIAWITILPLPVFVFPTICSIHMHTQPLFIRPYKYDFMPLNLVVRMFPQILMPNLKILPSFLTSLSQSDLLFFHVTFKNHVQIKHLPILLWETQCLDTQSWRLLSESCLSPPSRWLGQAAVLGTSCHLATPAQHSCHTAPSLICHGPAKWQKFTVRNDHGEQKH